MAWDRGAPSARSGDASKLLRLLVGKLHGPRKSVFVAKAFAGASGRRNAGNVRVHRTDSGRAKEQND